MVLAGQFLERPALVAADGGALVLEGLFHRGSRRPALLVCPAPGPGGGMDAPAVAELAWAAARAGHPSLRFQHRGVGASQGTADPARALDDARAALAHLEASARGPAAIAGVGAGAATALALAAEAGPGRCAGVALVAPAGVPAGALPGGVPVLVVLPERGAAAGPEGLRAVLGAAAAVEVVPGADPTWSAGLPRVGREVVEWMGRL
ncbi:MAG: alpha/beta hydrolase [Anaeromyxobacteraceae bacterium]